MASDRNVNDRREWPPVRERAAQLPTVEARKGVTGHHVRHVLGFGLAAIVIAFAIIYIIYYLFAWAFGNCPPRCAPWR